MLFKIAWKSLRNRWITVALTVISIAVSVFVLVGVEHIRSEARNSFSRTVSGTDLIVGARTGQLNLLLYSVFRMGGATNNISWQSYQHFAAHPQVSWTIPISLGDSHRGYPVMGTSAAYFEHFRYGRSMPLVLEQGTPFKEVFDVVLGAEVARRLNYSLGDKVVLAHGTGSTSFSMHDDKPFQVSGILAPTGTPVDQTLHVSLDGIEAIHIDWQHGAPMPGRRVSQEQVLEMDLTPTAITAFMVGLQSRMATFGVQRQINEYPREPLLAILPGIALSELWRLMGVMERILLLISALVLLAALLGMSTMLLASMRERHRELAILRALGGRPGSIFVLIQLEALLITLMGLALALVTLKTALVASQTYLSDQYGLFISHDIMNWQNLKFLAYVMGASLLCGLVPAVTAYRASLHTSLTHKH